MFDAAIEKLGVVPDVIDATAEMGKLLLFMLNGLPPAFHLDAEAEHWINNPSRYLRGRAPFETGNGTFEGCAVVVRCDFAAGSA